MQDDPGSFFKQRAAVSFHRRRKYPVDSEKWRQCAREAQLYIGFYRAAVRDMESAERGEIDRAEVLRRLYERLEKHLGRELPTPPECWGVELSPFLDETPLHPRRKESDFAA
jgi:hypothetical protein